VSCERVCYLYTHKIQYIEFSLYFFIERFEIKPTLGEQAVRLSPLLAHESKPNLLMNTSQAAC